MAELKKEEDQKSKDGILKIERELVRIGARAEEIYGERKGKVVSFGERPEVIYHNPEDITGDRSIIVKRDGTRLVLKELVICRASATKPDYKKFQPLYKTHLTQYILENGKLVEATMAMSPVEAAGEEINSLYDIRADWKKKAENDPDSAELLIRSIEFIDQSISQ